MDNERHIEVDNTFYDEESNYHCIDVWQDGNDEGHIAAVVNGTTGDVWWIDNTLRTNPIVKEAIQQVQVDINKFKGMQVGTSVRWNDPNINDYPAEERMTALAREFLIYEIDNDDDEQVIPTCYSRIRANDGVTDVEGYAWEFQPLRFIVLENGKELFHCKTRADVESSIKDLESGDKLLGHTDRVYEIKSVEI